MPYYHYHGRLVYFAAHTNHVGLYALGQTYKVSRAAALRRGQGDAAVSLR